MRKTKISVAVLLLALAGSAWSKPLWWDNPHRDDEFALYQTGSAEKAPSEQDAVRAAVNAAKTMLVERIGIASALENAGLAVSPEYAIVNFEVVSPETEKTGKGWSAWVLLKYPVAEKQKILDRWNASMASIKDLRVQESRIPVQFGLSLSTADGRTSYREGETVSFLVRAEADCYLVLLDHQSDGQTVILYPNSLHPDSFIRKGEQVRVPSGSDAGFALVVGEPFGDDRIEAIAATGKNSLHKRFTDLAPGPGESQPVSVVTRGLFVAAVDGIAGDGTPSGVRWSAAAINLSTWPGK